MSPSAQPALPPLPDGFAATRAALHRVAEEIVAPARKPDNEISLRATPGGFGTPPFEHEGAERQVRVDGAELVYSSDGEESRAALTSPASAGELVAELLPAGALDETPLDVDPDAAAALAAWFALGASALERLFDEAGPGDEQHDEPYLYVGPWTAEVSGDPWNARGFNGAELGYRDLAAAEDPLAAALAFCRACRQALEDMEVEE